MTWTHATALLVLLTAGCGPPPDGVRIDGSSTVYPISEAIAEAYGDEHPGARVTVGMSGTGGGFKKFAAGEIDLCNASREIKKNETELCTEAGVDFIRLSVAFDGIVIAVNPQNDWCDCLTVEQLASIWRPQDPVNRWNEINPEWPDEKIKLYGPGTDSGTFDYFTKVIVGKEKSCRADFTASEDDNVLVTGVSEDKHALAYFGFAYFAENASKLKAVGIEQQDGECIMPTVDSIRMNTYRPLSRPLFVYARNRALEQPLGRSFVRFYLDRAGELASEVGYVEVSERVAAENQAALEAVLPPATQDAEPNTLDTEIGTATDS